MPSRLALASALLGLLLLLWAFADAGVRFRRLAEDPIPQGRWGIGHAQRDAPLDDATLAELEAIGYASGSVPASDRTLVTTYDAERSYPGLNFYTSGHTPGALLMDMNGRVLHEWKLSFADAFPGAEVADWQRVDAQHWRRAHLYENGDVLAIFGGLGMLKVDKDSRLLWSSPAWVHHDAEVQANGDIFTLTREAGRSRHTPDAGTILEDFIVRFDASGKPLEKWSVLDALANSEYRSLIEARPKRSGDLFHTNSLQRLDGRIAALVPAFQEGFVLTSLRELNTIAVIDLERNRAVWALQGDFAGQHDPRILPDGKLLLFDNLDGPERSSVEILDPAQGFEEIWAYRGSPEQPFYTQFCGAAKTLPNDNLLITETDRGRAFEITRDHEIVWEFLNPERAGRAGEFVASIFELERLPLDFPHAWARPPAEQLH